MNTVYLNTKIIQFAFKETPKRIVSIVPSLTELLYDLGLDDSIVGITKFCVHPNHFKTSKTSVGGTKNVNFEKVKILQPDIIIANKEENTLEIVSELSKICPVWVTDVVTIEDNLQMILEFGTLFNKQSEALKWYQDINTAYLDFKCIVENKPTKKVAYFIWKNPYMVAGKNTFINTLLEVNNFENVITNQRYPEVDLENIGKLYKPDVLLLSSEPYPFKEKDIIEIEAITQNSKSLIVDGEMFSWYGSRILFAFEYFKKLQFEL